VTEYYELRRYEVRIGAQAARLEEYLRGAAIPGWNRAGVRPVGYFTPLLGAEVPSVYLLLPHPSIEAVVEASASLAMDTDYLEAAADFLDLPATDPGFVRAESTLLRAFESVPAVEVVPGAADGRPRIFELRRYESHSEAAAHSKIHMFDMAELGIFRRVGLRPVFFGQALIGARLPNLTYMLTFPDVATRERCWAAFRADPEWERLRSTPGFTDAEIVSNTLSILLRPLPGSQI
jgi:hypothetical protein